MDAADIVQTYLDEVSQAVMTDDWETYRAGVNLPLHLISHDETKVIATEDDLRDGWTIFATCCAFGGSQTISVWSKAPRAWTNR